MHTDGRPKKMGEKTLDERHAQIGSASATIRAELSQPAVQQAMREFLDGTADAQPKHWEKLLNNQTGTVAFKTWASARTAPRVYRGTEREKRMRLIIALILPWLTFFTIGRPFAGIICLILQLTVIGWLPATIWAVYALSQYKTDQKIERALGRRA